MEQNEPKKWNVKKQRAFVQNEDILPQFMKDKHYELKVKLNDLKYFILIFSLQRGARHH